MAASSGLYAAYGPNMDPEQMLERCPQSPFAGTGWIDGWRLTFGGERAGWEGARATIVEDAAGKVFVALYELSPHDHAELDRWEAADSGMSDKIRVRVATDDGDVVAFVYVLGDYEGGLPSAAYVELIADAARRLGAPEEYVAGLLARPCRPAGQ